MFPFNDTPRNSRNTHTHTHSIYTHIHIKQTILKYIFDEIYILEWQMQQFVAAVLLN